MALKRPAEKLWNWKRPAEPFPQTPGANGCFLAPSGMGKTTTLISMLLGPYERIFESIHVFSPSVEIDSAWDPVRDFAKGLRGGGSSSSFHHEWDAASLHELLDKQRHRIKDLKTSKTTKPLPQMLVVIDDFADRPDIMHSAGNVLTTLFIRGRHFGCSCWLSSQKLTAISTVARVNFRFLCVWRLRNRKEIQSLLEELTALYPVKVLLEMYQEAVSDEDHSFWYINLMAKKKEDMFYIRFDHKLIYD
jgi:hypothetical protein